MRGVYKLNFTIFKVIIWTLCLGCFVEVFSQSAIQYVDETDARIDAPANLSTSDTQEKDYAWGDVDQDGDIDLICVRKEPFTTEGKDINVLFLNEGGVLVESTSEYVQSSDISGDLGFQTATNDRDVILADINGDGWLDIITAPTLSDYDPKYISHPRIYINRGESDGAWLGFRYEDARIPRMNSEVPEAAPRFCSVAAGDIDDDGDLDLYFGDYDSGPEQLLDFNNRLLINNGIGYFADETALRLNSEMRESAFGAASVFADMNDDGALDIVKQTSLNPPQHIAITYNDPQNKGWFNDYQIIDENAPYFVSVDDLNGDGRYDLVVVDDAVDSYYLNTGTGPDGRADFNYYTLPGETNDFGGNSWVADLDHDGRKDVIITDVDVDISGCSRSTHLLFNNGSLGAEMFDRDSSGIPEGELNGVHDVAVFDLDGDGWEDMIFGTCDGMSIWMADPPISVSFEYQEELPDVLPPNQFYELTFRIIAGGSGLDPNSVVVRAGVGVLEPVKLEALGDNNFKAILPLSYVICGEQLEWQIEASNQIGNTYYDPPQGVRSVLVADGVEETYRNELEKDLSGWEVVNDPSLVTGAWEAVVPLGTIYNSSIANPDQDTSQEGNKAFVTQNGSIGGSVGEADVDGGPSMLITPVFDFSTGGGEIHYSRWMFDSLEQDFLNIEISSDGGVNWVLVESVPTTSGWEESFIQVESFIEPTNSVRVRFVIQDVFEPSVVEAGIDSVYIVQPVCNNSVECPADFNLDGIVNVLDLLTLVSALGSSDSLVDLDQSGSVDTIDLLVLVSSFGLCG